MKEVNIYKKRKYLFNILFDNFIVYLFNTSIITEQFLYLHTQRSLDLNRFSTSATLKKNKVFFEFMEAKCNI